MNSTRRKRIVRLALDYLQFHANEAEDQLKEFVENEESLDFSPSPDRIEIQVQSKTILAPTDSELEAIVGEGKQGNWRTRELATLALVWMRDNLADLSHDYYYQGEVERFVDTHITFDGENFREPTTEEIDELIEDIDLVVKMLPHVPTSSIGWNVYDLIEDTGRYEWIDTVFYDASCDRQYVRNGLVNHDGYNSSIALVC